MVSTNDIEAALSGLRETASRLERERNAAENEAARARMGRENDELCGEIHALRDRVAALEERLATLGWRDAA